MKIELLTELLIELLIDFLIKVRVSPFSIVSLFLPFSSSACIFSILITLFSFFFLQSTLIQSYTHTTYNHTTYNHTTYNHTTYNHTTYISSSLSAQLFNPSPPIRPTDLSPKSYFPIPIQIYTHFEFSIKGTFGRRLYGDSTLHRLEMWNIRTQAHWNPDKVRREM